MRERERERVRKSEELKSTWANERENRISLWFTFESKKRARPPYIRWWDAAAAAAASQVICIHCFVGSFFFLESGDAGISMAQGNVYGASEHNLFIQYNKTTCTFQVYTRFNCLFKRIPAFGLLFSLFSLFCIFTVSSSHGFFLRYPFVILLLFILILQWHRRCRRHCRGRRGDRALFFCM